VESSDIGLQLLFRTACGTRAWYGVRFPRLAWVVCGALAATTRPSSPNESDFFNGLLARLGIRGLCRRPWRRKLPRSSTPAVADHTVTLPSRVSTLLGRSARGQRVRRMTGPTAGPTPEHRFVTPSWALGMTRK